MNAASLYYAGLRALGLPAAVRQFRNAAVVLCYHNVVAEEPPELANTGLHLTQSRFREQMIYLAARYSVVPLNELITRMRAGKPLRKLAAITFDDAYRGVFECACPILAELRLPATVFVVTEAASAPAPFWWDHPDAARRAGGPSSARWLGDLRGDGRLILRDLGVTPAPSPPTLTLPATWDVIRKAARDGIDLGVHTATHRALPRLNDAELRSEVADTREMLANRSGFLAESFAYPYGLWDQRVRDAARAAGYTMALTLNAHLTTHETDPWAAPRVNIPAHISEAAFQTWIAGWSPHRAVRA